MKKNPVKSVIYGVLIEYFTIKGKVLTDRTSLIWIQEIKAPT